MNGITFIPDFVRDAERLFSSLRDNVLWDERMLARKTASFGVAYNYSQMSYPFQAFPPELEAIVTRISTTLGFTPNNCLINYYLDGKSKMGFHADQTDILEQGTGIAIVSVGETRTLRFKNIKEPVETIDFPLPAGSLIYMTQAVQDEWLHAIPASDTNNGRMSLTFRAIK
ncbi:alpha-ketoglutarate-dependent dioxygenase AlkB [Chitinophaga ginsengisoli]|uniref:2-oxoglutarate-Fe(II)-dependent oxygenase superfamily protein n=1 Tax=Chitinophaga ginsengisoli TaxID=363837 RepID=A0A2P8GLI7_9BACT|nr:alpha-ketoglutarate-dependent dioxygenase AlkB [Chitinophaga ginsengisoli]PSL34837.1 2-oxoglutarate-Fe(II)-dependent oxygenase superfamily protein [Chitinophaga ginsengisoli]